MPRFDSAPVFARLLDDDAGHFSIRPERADAYAVTWRYRASSLVLDTTWFSSEGEIVVSDAMALGARERGHQLGQDSPGVVMRQVRCTEGEVAVSVEFCPRPEFGLIHPRLLSEPGLVLAVGGATTLMLSTEVGLCSHDAIASTVVTLRAGEKLSFALTQFDAWGDRPNGWSPRKIRRRIAGAEASWQSWSHLHQRYEGPFRDLVLHSGMVLQGLTYAHTAAIVAAATTSLPEGVGSGRTWDYRFTWVRDASMTMQGLYVAACPDEASRFFAFLARSAGTQLDRGRDLQIMFGVGGERDLTEHALPHLTGWRDSGPVRVGNDAWGQRQLDVYGALLDAAFTLRDQLDDGDETHRSFLIAAVDAAATRWKEDDQGIWEIRGEARPFLHSKLMCWVALDRGVKLADRLRVDAPRLLHWRGVRQTVRDDIEARGWNDDVGAYTQSFGSRELDASALMLTIVGFADPKDPRMLATINAIEEQLAADNGLIYRYSADDGIEAPEGSFLLCTFWLAHAMALTGQAERARTTLERAAGYANALGLFSEQIDPSTGEMLGNFPQAFSHLGLVTAAQALADAERDSA